jgi:hypothetical protein
MIMKSPLKFKERQTQATSLAYTGAIWIGHVACMMRNACKILVRNPEGKRPLRKCRQRIELGEIVCDVVDWLHLA